MATLAFKVQPPETVGSLTFAILELCTYLRIRALFPRNIQLLAAAERALETPLHMNNKYIYLCLIGRCVFTLLSELVAVNVKQIRHRRASSSDTTQNSTCVVYAEILVERNANNGHAASSHISDQRD